MPKIQNNLQHNLNHLFKKARGYPLAFYKPIVYLNMCYTVTFLPTISGH